MKTDTICCQKLTSFIHKKYLSNFKIMLMLLMVIGLFGQNLDAQTTGTCNGMTTPGSLSCVGTVIPYTSSINGVGNGKAITWTITENTSGAFFTANGLMTYSTIAIGSDPNGAPNTVQVNVGPNAGHFTIKLSFDGNPDVGTCSASRDVRKVKVEAIAPPITCFGGTTTITAQASTQIVNGGPFTNQGGYEYTLHPPGTNNQTGIFTGVTANNYFVSVEDIFGCTAETPTINIVNPPANPVVLNCPPDVTEAACQTQDQITAKFNAWLAAFSTSGGTNPIVIRSPITPLIPSACGGSTTVTWTVTSDCESAKTCTKTFTITAPQPTQLTCPPSVNLPSCATQASVAAAWAIFLNGAQASGGCEGNLSNNAPANPPSSCGGSITVTWTYTARCGQTQTCSSTFTITPSQPPALISPLDVNLPPCTAPTAVHTAFVNWVNGFSVANPGCNDPLGERFVHVLASGARETITRAQALLLEPGLPCDGSLIRLILDMPDRCNSINPLVESSLSTFTLIATPPASIVCGPDVTIPACSTQAAIDGAWRDFLNSPQVIGGCGNALISNNAPANPPSACGGSVTVTFTAAGPVCGAVTLTCTKTFTVTAPVPTQITCPPSVNLPSCATQASVAAAWAIFLNGASASGGCDGNLSNNAPANPPSSCGGSVTVTWTYTARCGQTQTCSSTFTITPSQPPSLIAPPDVNLPPCTASPAVHTAFINWVNGFSVANPGCNDPLGERFVHVLASGARETITRAQALALEPALPCDGSLIRLILDMPDRCNSINPLVESSLSTFTLIATPPASIVCGPDVTIPACSTADQVASAWRDFLNSPQVIGGCGNALISNNAPANPPSKCGGSVTVTFTATGPFCNAVTLTCSKTFTVTSAPPIVFNCGTNVTMNPGCTQAQIDAAWAAFILSTTASGGCNGHLSNDAPANPPTACGSSVVVTWTYTTTCEPAKTCKATFALAPCPKTEECTLGYWKNHTDRWCPTYRTCMLFKDVFKDAPASLGNITLLDALNLGGGGNNLLARQGVAALLNACTLKYSAPYNTTQAVIDAVNNAYKTNTAGSMGSILGALNEKDNCTLGGTSATTVSNCTVKMKGKAIEINTSPALATSILAYPNPFKDHISFEITPSVSGNATLDIYNILGQRVQNVFDGYIEAGITQRVEYSHRANGTNTYIYVLKVGGETVTGKVINME